MEQKEAAKSIINKLYSALSSKKLPAPLIIVLYADRSLIPKTIMRFLNLINAWSLVALSHRFCCCCYCDLNVKRNKFCFTNYREWIFTSAHPNLVTIRLNVLQSKHITVSSSSLNHLQYACTE